MNFVKKILFAIKYLILNKVIRNKVRQEQRVKSLEQAQETAKEIWAELEEAKNKTDEQVEKIRKVSDAEIFDMLARRLNTGR